jgi:hypothetical protein
MSSTYEPIATTTLGSSQSSITFNSFGGYTDLFLVANVLANSSSTDYTMKINYNGDTTSGLYSDTYFYGTGSGSGASSRHSNQNTIYLQTGGYLSTTVPRTWLINIQNYANTNTHKTLLSRSSQANDTVDAFVGLWRNTNAITSFVLTLTGGVFGANSSFTLYGIKAE